MTWGSAIHICSQFEDFLAEEGLLEQCRASALKFKITHELEKAMSRHDLTKAHIAKRLKKCRAGPQLETHPKRSP